MLQHDYLLEIINEFVESITQALKRAYASDDEAEIRQAAHDVEEDIAALMDLDPAVTMSLSPDSLVTMMLLSGLGDAVCGYVAFALERLSEIYERMGDADTAAFRRQQVEAIVTSFGCDLKKPPAELVGLARALSAQAAKWKGSLLSSSSAGSV